MNTGVKLFKIQPKLHLPNNHEIEELKNFLGEHCLSIYAPYIKPNSVKNPNRIEIRNLVKQAHALLIKDGLKEREVDKIIHPMLDFLSNSEHTFSRDEGVAIFSHSSMFIPVKVPYATFPVSVTVSDKFEIRPLLDSIQSNAEYYLLTLGHKNVRLYAGDRYSLSEVHLKNFPDNMKGALRIDEYPKSRETHAIKPASYGKGSEAFHGQYNVAETDKKMLKEYFRRLDHFLHKFLTKHNKPLILAGVKYEVAMYQKINTYKGLVEEAIYGNQDESSPEYLREKSWNIISGQSS